MPKPEFFERGGVAGSTGRESTVDDQLRARDVGRIVTGQKQHGVGHLFLASFTA